MNNAPKNVQKVVQRRGSYIDIYLDNQQNVTKNNYGDIVQRNSPKIRLKAFPIQRKPSPKQIESVGARQGTAVLVYVSYLELQELGYNFNDIEQWNARIKVDGEMYKLQFANKYSQWDDSFLYVVFGGDNES